MTLAELSSLFTDAGAIAGVFVSCGAVVVAIGRIVLWATRKVAAEQDDRIGERVAREMAPVVKQVQGYSDDVKAALSEFRTGEKRTGREFLSVWKALATAGINRPGDEGDRT